jgi:hypothetical protein
MPARRFPPPWSAEETDACFIVRDADGQALVPRVHRGGEGTTAVTSKRGPSPGLDSIANSFRSHSRRRRSLQTTSPPRSRNHRNLCNHEIRSHRNRPCGSRRCDSRPCDNRHSRRRDRNPRSRRILHVPLRALRLDRIVLLCRRRRTPPS